MKSGIFIRNSFFLDLFCCRRIKCSGIKNKLLYSFLPMIWVLNKSGQTAVLLIRHQILKYRTDNQIIKLCVD